MKKKGRGLSYDEKKDRILKIFHDTKNVFNYDQVEKISIKAGVPFPQVKELLMSLKADDLVQCQKIGAGNFYWSFPSKAVQIFETKIAFSQNKIDYYKKEIQQLQKLIESNQKGREQTEQRESLLQTLQDLQQQRRGLQKEINVLNRTNIERVNLLRKQNDEMKNKINMEIDDLQQIKKFIKKQSIGIKDREIQELYGISADMAYL